MRTTVCCLLSTLILLCAAKADSAVTIGGSVLRNPPQYQSNSFFAFTPTFDEAFPFRTIPGDGWTIEGLSVPLYHYQGMAGDRAAFSIVSDNSGAPGSTVATFSVSNITTEAHVYLVAPSFVAGPLQGDTTYWLVGSNPTWGQVNWNLEWDTFHDAQRAYRVSGGDWVVQSGLGNVSSFAIEGSAVPEPSSIVLLGLGGIGLLAYAWKKRAIR
jgi:hypothetical protein